MIHQVRQSITYELGGKKSYHILMDDLKSMRNWRDKLFDILRANHCDTAKALLSRNH
jgi:hypothetical protein